MRYKHRPERAASLNAEERGPRVWISQGKHASFLSLETCNKGCGGDRCEGAVALRPHAIINIGEPGAPLNGAVWSASHDWPLAHKMRSDFSDAVLAQLANYDGELRVSGTHGHVQGVISVADSSYGGISAGFNGISASNESVADALTAAQVQTSHALASSARSTGAFLKKAGKFVRRKPATQD